jgi:hypothetical protein
MRRVLFLHAVSAVRISRLFSEVMRDSATSLWNLNALNRGGPDDPKNGSHPACRFQLQRAPHQALGMLRPAEIYRPSAQAYRGIGELSYPFHDRAVMVTCCGRICIYKKKINLSTALAGQAVGIKEVDDRIWLVVLWTRLYRSGGKSFAALTYSLWPKSVSYVFGTLCKGCLRTIHVGFGAGDGNRTHVRSLGSLL